MMINYDLYKIFARQKFYKCLND